MEPTAHHQCRRSGAFLAPFSTPTPLSLSLLPPSSVIVCDLLVSSEDHVLPFMLDKRMPADTLYLVFEEDFRWWPPGEDPDSADEYDRKTKPPWKTRKEKPVRLPPPAKGDKDVKGAGKKGEKARLAERRASGTVASREAQQLPRMASIGASSRRWPTRSASRISRIGTTSVT